MNSNFIYTQTEKFEFPCCSRGIIMIKILKCSIMDNKKDYEFKFQSRVTCQQGEKCNLCLFKIVFQKKKGLFYDYANNEVKT